MVFYAALDQGCGIQGLMQLFEDAVNGVYHPKNYTEEDILQGILLWKLGGHHVGQIVHCSVYLLGITMLQDGSTIPPLVPSHGHPTLEEVEVNLNASLEGILKRLSQEPGNVIHAVLCFDEIAIEKRLRWDRKMNYFLGVCQEHGSSTSLEFNNLEDLDELLRAIDQKEVHYASEHLKLLQVTLTAVEKQRTCTRIWTVSIASDGESKHGCALAMLTMKKQLSFTSPIYPQLQGLHYMNLLVEDNDAHLCEAGHLVLYVNALFKPEDKQDVKLAYDLLSAIWKLPEASPETTPGFQAQHSALCTLEVFLHCLLYLIICVNLSLQEQMQYLSAASHLGLVLFCTAKQDFLPSLLYSDIQIMIKNVFVCVAKAKVDNPNGVFFIIILGTDWLEIHFRILRTQIGNDANMDEYQLASWITGMTEVANILAEHPEWD
ncbi:hypothetical protein ARMGADRAFT_1043993 [Armillaria gallica]|uniref:Uncharacterized protein n=1 Tax=Armillaria gallica TaxID=47427 RepID=A0A2H3E4S9_ARMGA|nr:hypothetical protein ARMGADRAFT_1043993 [Armillaria gallica]